MLFILLIIGKFLGLDPLQLLDIPLFANFDVWILPKFVFQQDTYCKNSFYGSSREVFIKLMQFLILENFNV